MAEDGPTEPGSLLGWFSSDLDTPSSEGPAGWRLDVVTLLAVIGESSIAEHAQTITASMLCLFPRIIPAPQALLKPSRPLRLPETTAKMTGVYSGVVLDTVGFFANIIHPLDELQPFSFKVLEIKHSDRKNGGGVEARRLAVNGTTFFSRLRPRGRSPTNIPEGRSARLRPPPDAHGADGTGSQTRSSGFNPNADIEAGSAPPQLITRKATMKEKVQDFVADPRRANREKRPAIPASLYSPVHILSVFSALLTCGIIAFAAFYQDGTAIFAVSLVSVASSVVGLASWWKPRLMNRSHTNQVPKGDVIIRTREGAFLLVRCTEEVARELYSGTEECEYHVGGRAYRALMGLGTFLLMVSVILLGNCKWYTQIFIGASYITLNGLYWCMGLIPRTYFWDLSRYDYKDVTPDMAKNADKTTNSKDDREGVKSFTRTLWFAIRETKRTAWVERSGAAPITQQWRKWLAEAEQAAKDGNTTWAAVARKDEIMKIKDSDDVAKSPVNTEPTRDFDEAEQAAPAQEVQPGNQGQNQYQGAL